MGRAEGCATVTASVLAPARLYGNGDGLDPGIEAFGLSVRIEVGEWDLAVSAIPVADDGWRGVPLDERLPDLIRALNLLAELRAGGPRQTA